MQIVGFTGTRLLRESGGKVRPEGGGGGGGLTSPDGRRRKGKGFLSRFPISPANGEAKLAGIIKSVGRGRRVAKLYRTGKSRILRRNRRKSPFERKTSKREREFLVRRQFHPWRTNFSNLIKKDARKVSRVSRKGSKPPKTIPSHFSSNGDV